LVGIPQYRKADKSVCAQSKLIQAGAIYCLILISDSIMVPCYGRITPNTKGCVNSCRCRKEKKEIFSTNQESLGKAWFSGKEGS
jgi:hypothetical protein